ncbi:MAG: 2-oxoacid:acceptor oxidoreductase family protein, partial [Candidatus Omnitrophota bacterium]
MLEKVIFSGFGGQGVLFMGKLLASSCMNDGLHVTWMPSYGAEVRGGTAHSMVVVSDDAIASPAIFNPTSVIAMNEPSLLKFEQKIMPGGLLVLNTSLISRFPSRKDIEVLEIPATDTADKLGSTKVANMVCLGAYC